MPLYKIFDITLDCDMLLPELPLVTDCKPDIRISSVHNARGNMTAVRWIHEWVQDDGKVTIACGRSGEEYVLRFPDNCDFFISTDEGCIYYYRQKKIPLQTLRHLLLDQVLPRFLAHQGHLVLHASAIRLANGRGIAFCGPSGAGKSTLAASFSENGAQLLTDDCLLLRVTGANVIGIASYRGLRLFDDSLYATYATISISMAISDVAHYSDKRRVLFDRDSGDIDSTSVVIDAIFMLQESEVNAVQIVRLDGAQTVMAIVKQLFVLDPRDTDLAMQNLRAITELIKKGLSVLDIDYPRNHSFLNEVRETILATHRYRRIDTSHLLS